MRISKTGYSVRAIVKPLQGCVVYKSGYLQRAMATRKSPKKARATANIATEITERQFVVVLEDLNSKFQVFGEALQGLQERMDHRFERIESDLALVKEDVALVKHELVLVKEDVALVKHELALVKEDVALVKHEVGSVKHDLALVKDAVRTHSNELQRIETKLDTVIADHGARLDKLEGAAE